MKKVDEASAKYTKYVQACKEEYMDIEIPCMVADCIPSLIDVIDEQQKKIEESYDKIYQLERTLKQTLRRNQKHEQLVHLLKEIIEEA